MTTTEDVERVPLDGGQRRAAVPGGWEIWFFVLGEMTIFALYFGVYAYRRGLDNSSFHAAQRALSTSAGAVNTLLLLTSSLFVVFAVRSARRDDPRARSQRFIVMALVCGTAFVGVKVYEWASKIRAGVTISSNEFMSYYYMLTAIHLGHVLIGMIVLLLLWRHLRDAVSVSFTLLDSGAIYWHMVDLLWIVIFPLLYLMR